MKKKLILYTFIFVCSFGLTALTVGAKESWTGGLKGGIRIQKSHKLYWENGIALDYCSHWMSDRGIHLGASYVTSRLGSAMGSNAIKQDNYLLSPGYYFRHQKHFQPFTRLNLGYFHADYEYAIFDALPKKALLLSIDAGVSYQFSLPVTIGLSAGYNFNTGNGTTGPGTLYPVFYQMSIYYTLLKKR